MAESSTVVSLRHKRAELEGQIAYLEGKIGELRADLVHLHAVLRMFEGDADEPQPASHRMRLNKVFGPGEYLSLALDAIRENGGPMTSSEIAAAVIARRGWDARDLVLRRTVIKRLADALRKAHRRGAIGNDGMVDGVKVWALP